MARAGYAMLLAGAIAPSPGAAVSADDEVLLGRCIQASSQGRRWLAVTLWSLRDQEGGWPGAAISNRDGSHDLGPLQINSWWVPRLAGLTGRSEADIRRSLVHDSCFNVDAARWIFLTALKGTRDYWSAVGAYHSPSPPRARRYALMVAAKMRRRFGTDVFGPATGPPRKVRPAPGGRTS